MDPSISEWLISAKGPLKDSTLGSVELLGKGLISETWKIHLQDGRELFAKISREQNFQSLQFEAQGLLELKKFTNPNLLLIPEVLTLNKVNQNAILLLPWLDLTNGSQSLLGQGLALLHQESSNHNPHKFGWGTNGFIGAGIQPKGWKINWGESFVTLRLLPQLKIASKWGISISDHESLLSKIINLLDSHNPKPSLVHGDLWCGNASVLNSGTGVLIDPAAWWADREVDLAMTKLFGGFSNEFYESYASVWPLPSNFEERAEIYNLYHLLNHANLFGGSYQAQCISTLKLLAKIFEA